MAKILHNMATRITAVTGITKFTYNTDVHPGWTGINPYNVRYTLFADMIATAEQLTELNKEFVATQQGNKLVVIHDV